MITASSNGILAVLLTHTNTLSCTQPGDPYMETEEFRKEVKKSANQLLGEIEWRRRQLEKKIEDEQGVCVFACVRAWCGGVCGLYMEMRSSGRR